MTRQHFGTCGDCGLPIRLVPVSNTLVWGHVAPLWQVLHCREPWPVEETVEQPQEQPV